MFAEGVAVVDRRLQVDGAVALGAEAVGEVLGSLSGLLVEQVAVGVASRGVVGVRGFGETVARVVVGVEREHARDRKPFVELLRDAQVRVDLAAPLVGVTRCAELCDGVEVAAREGSELAVGIERCDVGRGREVGRFEDARLRGGRVVGVGQVALDAQFDLGGAERVEREVRSDVVTAVEGVRIVVGQFRVLIHAVLVVIGQADVVDRLVGTALHVDVGRTVAAEVTQDLFHPVYVGVEVGVIPAAGLFDDVAAVKPAAAAGQRCLVRHFHVGRAVGEIGDLGRFGKAFRIAYAEFGAPFQTVLGVDDNDAVGAADTVNGRCRRIFEDRETLDVLGVDVGERAGDAVDECQRSAHAGRQGRDAADVDVGVVEAGFAGPLD